MDGTAYAGKSDYAYNYDPTPLEYTNGTGYSRLPEEDYPPPPVNPSHYNPYSSIPTLPPVQQQQSNTNVVVVNQPQSQPEVYHTTVVAPKTNTFLLLAAILMFLCFFHGNLVAFVCLIPALICSFVAESHKSAGRHEEARTCGNLSLFCNLCSLIYFLVLVAGVVAVVITVVVVGTDVVSNIFQSQCRVISVDDSDITLCS